MIQTLLFTTRPQTTGEFEKFWKAYPRKVGRPRAQLLFKRLCEKEPESIQKIMEAIEFYKADIKKRNIEDIYVLHPATFLNQRRWEDDTCPKDDPLQKIALSEWAALVSYVSKFGRYGPSPLPLSEQGIKALREIGGFSKVCNSTNQGVEKLKSLFVEEYIK